MYVIVNDTPDVREDMWSGGEECHLALRRGGAYIGQTGIGE